MCSVFQITPPPCCLSFGVLALQVHQNKPLHMQLRCCYRGWPFGTFAVFYVVARVSRAPCLKEDIEWWNSTNGGRRNVTFLRSFGDAASSENKHWYTELPLMFYFWARISLRIWVFLFDEILMTPASSCIFFFFSSDCIGWFCHACRSSSRSSASYDNVGRRD